MSNTPISSMETDITIQKEELYTDNYRHQGASFRVEAENFNLPAGANSRARIECGNTDGKVPQWAFANSSSCSNSGRIGTAQSNDYIKVGFYGTGISVIAQKSSSCGIIACAVDGGTESNVDLYGASTYQVNVYSINTLNYGYHELIIRNTNSKNSAGTGYFALIDAFDIYTESQKTIDNSNNIKREDMTVTITPKERTYSYNFGGKTSGSTTANRNISKFAMSASITAPSAFPTESSVGYAQMSLSDGTLATIPTTTNSQYAQQLYSFDLSNLGVNDIVKNYIRSINFKWKGYSESINALVKDFYTNLNIWNNTTSAWDNIGVIGGTNATFDRASTRYNTLGTLVANKQPAYEQLTTGNVLSNGTVNLFSYGWEQGTTNSVSGISWLQNKVSSTTYIRTINTVPVFPNATYKLSFTPTVSTKTILIAVYYFDANGNYVSYSGWQNFSYTALTMPSNCYYAAALIKYSDSSTITTSVVTDHAVSFIQFIEESTVNLLTANQASVEVDTTGFNSLSSATITRDSSEYYNGSYSLKTVTPGSVSGEGYHVSSVVVDPSRVYTCSVWLKGSGTVKLDLTERDTNENNIGSATTSNITLSTTWTRYSVTRTFGSTGVKAKILIYTTSIQAITFYADCLQLEQKAYATSWTLGTRGNSYESTVNLLTDNMAGVETNTTGFATTDASVTISRDTVEYYNGVASLKTVLTGVADQGSRTDSVDVSANTTFTASAYLKGSGTIYLRIDEFTAGDVSRVGLTTTAITLTSTWTRYSVTRTFGSTGVRARIYLIPTTAQSVTFYADCLQLEAKDHATAWTLPSQPRTATWEALPYGKCVLIEEGTTNLLTESQASIETDVTGFASFQGTETYIKDNTEFLHGNSCIKFTTTGSTTSEGIYTAMTTVAVSQTYTFSVWLKGNGYVYIGLNERNSSTGSVTTVMSSQITLTSQWKRYSVTATFGSSGDRARCYVYTGTTVNVATCYIDCLQLEQKAYATTWTLPSAVRAAETVTLPTTGLPVSAGTIEGIVQINDNCKRQVTGVYPTIFYIIKSVGSDGIVLRHSSNSANWTLVSYADDASYSSTSISDSSIPNGIYYYKCYWSSSSMVLEFWDLVTRTKTYSVTKSSPKLPSAFVNTLYLGYNSSTWYANTRFGKHKLSDVAITTDPDFSYLMQQDANTIGIWEFNDSLRNSVLDNLNYTRDYDLSKYVDSSNKMHFMATTKYASDGTYVSAVNTDYVELNVNHCYAKLNGIEEQNGRVNVPSGIVPSAATFSRTGTRYGVNGNVVTAGNPDYSQFPLQNYSNAITVEEGTTNLVPIANQQFVGGVPYSGATVTLTQNQVVPEWGCSNATRYQVSGGTSTTKHYIAIVSPSVNGQAYATSLYIKNTGVKRFLITNNLGPIMAVDPGYNGILKWTCTGNGTSSVRLQFMVDDANDQIDCIMWRPQVEGKAYSTTWTDSTRIAEILTLPTAGLSPQQGTIEGIVELNDVSKRSVPGHYNVFCQIKTPSIVGMAFGIDGNSGNWCWQVRNDWENTKVASGSVSLTPNGWYYYKVYWSSAIQKLEIWDLSTRTKIINASQSNPYLPSTLISMTVGHNKNNGEYANTRFGKHKLSNVAVTTDPDFTNLMPVDENTLWVSDFNNTLNSQTVYYTKPIANPSSAITMQYGDTVTMDYTSIAKNGTEVASTFNAPMALPEDSSAVYKLNVDSTSTADLDVNFNYVKSNGNAITQAFVENFEVGTSDSYKTIRRSNSIDPEGFLLQERNSTISMGKLWINGNLFTGDAATYHITYKTDPTVGNIEQATYHLCGVRLNDLKVQQKDNALISENVTGMVTKIIKK